MDPLEANRRKMIALLSAAAPEDGAHSSVLPDVTLLRAAQASKPVPVLYTPCVVIVAQGRKRFHLPDRVLCYDAHRYLTVTVPIPADCETLAGEEGPFLGFAVRIDLGTVSDLLLLMGESAEAGASPRALGGAKGQVVPLDPAVSDAGLRLVELLASPAEARVLGPLRLREFLYRVLLGPASGALRDLVLGSTARMQVHRTLDRMHQNWAAPLDVPALARAAGMSVSAFHFHFRAIAASSPVQYLKTLRLHKARMLMVQTAMGAGEAAARVGYESPSQFSREFKRLFGAPPAEEAERVRKAFGYADAVSAAS